MSDELRHGRYASLKLAPATFFGWMIGTRRWPRWSFVAAVIFAVAGTSSLYLSGFVTLLGTMAPFAEPPAAPTVATAPIPTSASNWSSTGTT